MKPPNASPGVEVPCPGQSTPGRHRTGTTTTHTFTHTTTMRANPPLLLSPVPGWFGGSRACLTYSQSHDLPPLIIMPITFTSFSDRRSGVAETLQAEVMRLRRENAALRIECSKFDVSQITSANQAEAMAQLASQLVSQLAVLATRLRASESGKAIPTAAMPLPSRVSSAQPHRASEACEHTAPLSTMSESIMLPVRGSYLVERWKRRERCILRRALPPRATWSHAEIERLAALLSDAFDEAGQPAWSLVTLSHNGPKTFVGDPLPLDVGPSLLA